MTTSISRREFLAVTASAAGGLLIGRHDPAASVQRSAGSGLTRLTPFIEIGSDGTVVLFAPKPDVGTGTLTSLPMLIAEELEADWSRIVVRQAPIDPVYGDQGVGGSDSVLSSYDELRRAGALGRTLLVSAAAAMWKVPPEACRAKRSVISNGRTGATLTFGEVAGTAARQPIPQPLPPLKSREAMTIIGTRSKGPTTRDVVQGSARYGIDVRIPGMLYASIQKCAVYGGRVRRVNDRAALAIPGVRRVIVLDGAEHHIWLRPGVAVIADSTWAALKGREVLEIEWDDGDGIGESTERIRGRFAEHEMAPSKIVRQAGDVERGLREARYTIDATYELPFLAHAPMEPINCTAHVDGGTCRVWGPIQLPMKARDVVSAVIGMPKESVTVSVTRIGGGFGRRLLSDYAAEAAMLSKLTNAPIHVTWTREDDIAHDYFRPASRHRVRAGVDADGRISVWDHRVAGTPNDAYPGDVEIDGLLAPRGDDAKIDFEDGLTPKLITNYRLGTTTVPTRIQTGSLRAPAWNSNVFVVESVIDELARASGIDPVALRLRIIGGKHDFPFTGPARRWYYDPSRLLRLLETVVDRARWRERAPNGIGRGLAAHFSMTSYAAHVIDVSVDAQKTLRITRVVSVVDCGTVVNPAGVEAQVQSAVIDGLSAALFGEVRIENGRAVPQNFDTYRLLRNHEVPPIDIHVIDDEPLPTGIGEIPYPAVAPALTSAIFAACGVRVRRLPVIANGFVFAV